MGNFLTKSNDTQQGVLGKLFTGVKDLLAKDDPESLKTGAYYVNFPSYDVQINNDGDRAKLGHAGVLVVNEDGSKRLYEYGRYNGRVLGTRLGRDEDGNNRGN